jgi:hypothetical protein
MAATRWHSEGRRWDSIIQKSVPRIKYFYTRRQMHKRVEYRVAVGISYQLIGARLPEFVVRLNGNSYSEFVPVRRERSHILVVLVACAIGATTSAAVILSLGDFPMTQTSVPPISPQAIVRNVSVTSEPTKTAEDRTMVESRLPSAVTSLVSGRNEPVTQAEAEHRAEVHAHQPQKHRQQRSRELHWQGHFAHGSWRVTRFNTRRDELASGVR